MKDKSLRDMMREKNVSPDNMTTEQKTQFSKLKDKVDQYKNKDTSDMMRELDRLKQTQEVKAKLNGKELDNFANTLKPMLNREQQRKLDDLVKHLRKS